MDNNLALSALELVLRRELNCNASIESDSFFWFGLLSFSEVIDKVSQSEHNYYTFFQMWCSLYTSRCAKGCYIALGC